jgi:hypothetical protein
VLNDNLRRRLISIIARVLLNDTVQSLFSTIFSVSKFWALALILPSARHGPSNLSSSDACGMTCMYTPHPSMYER